jgi:hypothetical protein
VKNKTAKASKKSSADASPENASEKKKGADAADLVAVQSRHVLTALNLALQNAADEIKEINPADLRLQALRRRGSNALLPGSSSAKKLLGKNSKATSAVRLRLNMCGSPNCMGCPHAHWGVWRAYRDHNTGAMQHMMSEVKSREQLFAYARNAPDARTMDLVKQSIKLIDEKKKLVEALVAVGRLVRASKFNGISSPA